MLVDGGHVEPSFSVDLCDQSGNYQSLVVVGSSTSLLYGGAKEKVWIKKLV